MPTAMGIRKFRSESAKHSSAAERRKTNKQTKGKGEQISKGKQALETKESNEQTDTFENLHWIRYSNTYNIKSVE